MDRQDLRAINNKWERLKEHIQDRQRKEVVKCFTCAELLKLMDILERRME